MHEHHDRVNRPLLKQLLAREGLPRPRRRGARAAALVRSRRRRDGPAGRRPSRTRSRASGSKRCAPLSFVPTRAVGGRRARGARASRWTTTCSTSLDSTMTHARAGVEAGCSRPAAFAEDNPAGLAFVLDRLEPAELARVKRSAPGVSRTGVAPGRRRRRCGARRSTRSPPPNEHLGGPALSSPPSNRLDGEPGGGAAAAI